MGHYLLLFGLVENGEVAPAVAVSSFGFIVRALINYTPNYFITFKSEKPHHEVLAKFLFMVSVGFVLNAAFLQASDSMLRTRFITS